MVVAVGLVLGSSGGVGGGVVEEEVEARREEDGDRGPRERGSDLVGPAEGVRQRDEGVGVGASPIGRARPVINNGITVGDEDGVGVGGGGLGRARARGRRGPREREEVGRGAGGACPLARSQARAARCMARGTLL